MIIILWCSAVINADTLLNELSFLLPNGSTIRNQVMTSCISLTPLTIPYNIHGFWWVKSYRAGVCHDNWMVSMSTNWPSSVYVWPLRVFLLFKGTWVELVPGWAQIESVWSYHTDYTGPGRSQFCGQGVPSPQQFVHWARIYCSRTSNNYPVKFRSAYWEGYSVNLYLIC